MMNSLSSPDYPNGFNDVSHEGGSLAMGTARVEDLLSQGESFNVVYREAGDMIGEGTTRAENIGAIEAIDFFLGEASNFDRYMATWDDIGELSNMRVYENRREGLLGRILPKRGDEIIFEYVEE